MKQHHTQVRINSLHVASNSVRACLRTLCAGLAVLQRIQVQWSYLQGQQAPVQRLRKSGRHKRLSSTAAQHRICGKRHVLKNTTSPGQETSLFDPLSAEVDRRDLRERERERDIERERGVCV